MEREMYKKLNQIRTILEETNEPRNGNPSDQVNTGHKVGIFFTLREKDVAWLNTALTSQLFYGLVGKIKLINISDIKGKMLEKLVTKFTFCIYISRADKWKHGKSHPKRDETLSILGKTNLVLVIDDVEDSSDETQTRILQSHQIIKRYVRGLFLFSRLEKESDYNKLLPNALTLELQNSFRGPQADSSPQEPMRKKHKVGIFSRAGERDFAWLVTLLTSEDCRDHVLDVRSCYISNNGSRQFREDVSQCTFGILYHTKNRGRVNITDVKESLYDDELIYLCTVLGKENVIVVIDDLEDSSNEEKIRILQTQPKIAACACDLILISYTEKSEEMGQLAKLKILKPFRQSPKHELRKEVLPFPSSSEIANATPIPSRSTIGIFSRSEEVHYSWLRRLLTFEDSGTKDVRSYKISSNDNETLRVAAFQCKFGILYHTMKSGKIRITDVKDSQYQEELERLSAKFGKRKMIVVIDDLEDSSDKIKYKILENQPTIRKLAVDIFLFSVTEKKYLDGQNQEKYGKKMTMKSTNEKIMKMKEMLN